MCLTHTVASMRCEVLLFDRLKFNNNRLFVDVINSKSLIKLVPKHNCMTRILFTLRQTEIRADNSVYIVEIRQVLCTWSLVGVTKG